MIVSPAQVSLSSPLLSTRAGKTSTGLDHGAGVTFEVFKESVSDRIRVSDRMLLQLLVAPSRGENMETKLLATESAANTALKTQAGNGSNVTCNGVSRLFKIHPYFHRRHKLNAKLVCKPNLLVVQSIRHASIRKDFTTRESDSWCYLQPMGAIQPRNATEWSPWNAARVSSSRVSLDIAPTQDVLMNSPDPESYGLERDSLQGSGSSCLLAGGELLYPPVS